MQNEILKMVQEGRCGKQEIYLDWPYSGNYNPRLMLFAVTVSGNEQFRGVFLQGRLVADDTTTAGTFAATDSQTRLSSCTPPEVAI